MRFAREHDFDAAIQAAATQYGVDPALIAAVIGHESSFDPTAFRPEPQAGDGSAGLMQILLATARGVGYDGDLGDRWQGTGLFDPTTNIQYGTAYLKRRLSTLGDVGAALSAYNGGYRPSLGFGAKATSVVQVCLAHDTVTGDCINVHTVYPGEYANQDYVNAVLDLYQYFQPSWASGGFPGASGTPATTPTGSGGTWWWLLAGAGIIAGLVELRRRRVK